MNDLYDLLLPLCIHFNIAWQAQPPPKDISANLPLWFLWYIRITAPSSKTARCNKRMIPINRLHMHWFPYGSSFCMKIF